MTPLAAVGEQTVGAEVEAAGKVRRLRDSPGERRWQLDQGGTREGGRSGDGRFILDAEATEM